VVIGWFLGVVFSAAMLPVHVQAQSSAQERPPPIAVGFQTEDGIRIKADFTRPRGAKPVVVMLHGVAAGRREWDPLVSELRLLGFGTLQLDARGHGESGGPRFDTFRTPESWEALGKDLDAALLFLRSRGYGEERAVLAGASIGANLVLRCAVRHPLVGWVVMLSPGIAYQGLRIKPDFLRFERPVLMAAAPDDPYATKSCEELSPYARNPAVRFLRAGSGHGAQMFSGEVNRPFLKELLRWMSERSSSAARKT
jgi:alpha-beta hydrolase superfamily lysophospholipase